MSANLFDDKCYEKAKDTLRKMLGMYKTMVDNIE